jgi:protein SCO1/2
MAAPLGRKLAIFGGLFLLIGLPILWIMFLRELEFHGKPIPYYGPKFVNEKGDTVYHQVGPFEFTDQYGKRISNTDFDSCIYFANIFFSTCPDVCPRMNSNLRIIANAFKDNPKVKFISHTVDPDTDSLPLLRAYADRHDATKLKWSFVRGSKVETYSVAVDDYLLGVKDDKASNFMHSDRIVLVDRNKHIRGIFNGTAGQLENNKAIDAVKALIFEEREQARHK